jgi:hypothetical protein
LITFVKAKLTTQKKNKPNTKQKVSSLDVYATSLGIHYSKEYEHKSRRNPTVTPPEYTPLPNIENRETNPGLDPGNEYATKPGQI